MLEHICPDSLEANGLLGRAPSPPETPSRYRYNGAHLSSHLVEAGIKRETVYKTPVHSNLRERLERRGPAARARASPGWAATTSKRHKEATGHGSRRGAFPAAAMGDLPGDATLPVYSSAGSRSSAVRKNTSASLQKAVKSMCWGKEQFLRTGKRVGHRQCLERTVPLGCSNKARISNWKVFRNSIRRCISTRQSVHYVIPVLAVRHKLIPQVHRDSLEGNQNRTHQLKRTFSEDGNVDPGGP